MTSVDSHKLFTIIPYFLTNARVFRITFDCVSEGVYADYRNLIRGPIEIKNVLKREKMSKSGGGISSGDQKVHNSKCGLFDKRGGIFSFYSQM